MRYQSAAIIALLEDTLLCAIRVVKRVIVMLKAR
jgi:hypothetical protein